MIQYIEHKNINKTKWDQCISNSVNGIIYAYSWYLDIACENKWDAIIENDYERVFPLPFRKKLGVDYLYPPFFIQQLGIFSKTILTESITQNLLNEIPAKFKFFEINLNTLNKFDSKQIQIKENLNHELDLISPYDLLYSNYSENAKRNLKKSNKYNLVIKNNIDPEIIISLFRKNRGQGIKNLNDKEYEILGKIVKICTDKNMATTKGVYNENGEICGGAIFLQSNGKVIFLFSATNSEAKTNHSMTFLIDNFIKENAQRNLILDFEGSNDENLARFYKSFGSKECVYLQIKKENLNWFYKNALKIRKYIK
ncbi:MAG: hypothetical protein HXX09_04380 [Bacteroidetes bacterium]|nr:hypothetical protein [Bacteroidota bacterium]